MPEVPPAKKPDPYAAWRNPGFRLYAVSWFLQTFSKQIETIALGIYIYYLTGEVLSLAWVGVVQAVPVMVLAIAGGHLADRFNRRRILLSTLALSVMTACGLALTAHFEGPIWWIYCLLGISSVGMALGSPSRSSILPQIVSTELFPNAITWSTSMFHIASMTGPAVGGLMIGLEKSGVAAFCVVAAMRFFSVLALFFLKVPDHEKSTESISWESVVAGVRFVRKTKLILAAITLDLFAVLLGGCAYLLPVFVKDILHVDKSFAGYLRSSEAVGAVCMAVLLTHLPPMKRAGRTMLLAVAGFGVATIVFGVSHWCWLSLTAMFFLGALDNISIVVRHTLVQMLTPDVMRGRVSAVNNIFIVSSNEIGGVESAVTAWLFGSAVASVIFGGIGTIVVVLCAVVAWPQLLALGSLQNIRPAEEETEEFSRDP